MGLLSFFRRISGVGGGSSREFRVLVLGLDNAGKTTILKILNDEDVSEITPTTGSNVKSIVISSGVRLHACDMGGQRRIRPFWRSQFAGTDVLIYVVDSADRERLGESAVEFQILMEERELGDVPVLVFANKQDLEGRLDAEEIAAAFGVFTLARAWRVQPCSTATREGIREGVEWLSRAVQGVAAAGSNSSAPPPHPVVAPRMAFSMFIPSTNAQAAEAAAAAAGASSPPFNSARYSQIPMTQKASDETAKASEMTQENSQSPTHPPSSPPSPPSPPLQPAAASPVHSSVTLG